MADFDTTTWSTDSLTKATATTSTNNNVTLGVTLAVTGATTLSSTLTVTGAISGYLPYPTNVGFFDSPGDTVFIPFIAFTENNDPDSDSTANRIIMPYAGYLDKIIFRTSNSADTCDFEVYKAVSGTSGDDADQNKLSSTVSVEDGTANTTITASFGTNYFFAAGDIMAIKMTYESIPYDIDMVVIWKILVD